jgi:hypothetical protein
MVEIDWPDFSVTVEAELFDQENPELCDAFWKALPFKTVFAASMSAGEMFKVPLIAPLAGVASKNLVLMPDEPDGTICALGKFALIVKYGIMVEPFQLPRIARVTNDELTKLRNVAVRLRDAYFFSKEVNMATFRRKQ